MSNIYIQEPPTNGKVIMKTSIGEIEIELWSKETPKACRNFIQLCMEGYYNGTIFHRVVKDFIAQGGDPTGSGEGGESIYGEPFKDEFHSRLRFNRRGLLAMANAGVDDNGSQFFFTLGPTPELQKKHTIFGKVAGNTIYNMIKLNECEVIDERPTRPEKIISTEVIFNPFDDVKPRNLIAAESQKDFKEEEKADKKKGVKNFNLLSFGEEAEGEEVELESAVQVLKSKPKSAHDVGDPKLSSQKVYEDVVRTKKTEDKSKKHTIESSDESCEDKNEQEFAQKSSAIERDSLYLESIKSKLQKGKKTDERDGKERRYHTDEDESKLDEQELKKKQTLDEIKRLQREIIDGRKKSANAEIQKKEKAKEAKEEVEVVKKYKEDVEKYEHLKNKKLKSAKEDKTLELLNSFRNRLFQAKSSILIKEDDDDDKNENYIASDAQTDKLDNEEESILTHKLELDEEVKKKVIDANIADHDRYDIYDPRNPLNKRKREESKAIIKEKKRSHFSTSSHEKYSI